MSKNEQEKPDTLLAIAAEMRAYGSHPPPRLMWLEIADRIEAARTREREAVKNSNQFGNAAAMREALVEARQIVAYTAHRRFGFMRSDNGSTKVILASETLEKVDAALSAPPRQCDVGTAEDLGMRYNAFCRKHFTPDQLGGNCHKCPLKDRRGWSCQLAWAQTPYSQEGVGE